MNSATLCNQFAKQDLLARWLVNIRLSTCQSVLSIRFLNNWVNTGFVASLILKSKNLLIETIRSVNHRMFWAPLMTDKEGELKNNEDDPLPAIL